MWIYGKSNVYNISADAKVVHSIKDALSTPQQLLENNMVH